jgi:hypothetical protein
MFCFENSAQQTLERRYELRVPGSAAKRTRLSPPSHLSDQRQYREISAIKDDN